MYDKKYKEKFEKKAWFSEEDQIWRKKAGVGGKRLDLIWQMIDFVGKKARFGGKMPDL